MPLLQCIDCGAMVSDAAPACPSCGRPAWRPPVQQQAPPPPRPASSGAQTAQAVGAMLAFASLPTCAFVDGHLAWMITFLLGCAIFGLARLAAATGG